MAEKLAWFSLALAAVVLALGYALSAWWVLTPIVLVPGGLWALGRVRGWSWASSAGFVGFVLVATAGLWLGAWAGLSLFGVLAALSAWDLDQFRQRMHQAGRVEGREELERRHLRRLLLVDVLGLALGAAALLLQVYLSFFGALLLGTMLMVGLTQVILYLRHEQKG